MRFWLVLSTIFFVGSSWAQTNGPLKAVAGAPSIVVIIGAAGEAEFGAQFLQQAEVWRGVCSKAGAPLQLIKPDENSTTNQNRQQLESRLQTEPKQSIDPLWLVFIGHGTFDGREARFNLQGPDITATELALWLQPFQRPLAIINTSSASAPFINRLSATNRIIITATRSGDEQNYTRFGQFFATTLTNLACDLDADQQVSLLEAFLSTSHRVAEFYENENRLATEHALIDDNGDGLGTPAEWFRGVRAIKKAADESALDGALAHQCHLVPNAEERAWLPERRARRDALERSIFQLRETKDRMKSDDYFAQLEALLLELARLVEAEPLKPQ